MHRSRLRDTITLACAAAMLALGCSDSTGPFRSALMPIVLEVGRGAAHQIYTVLPDGSSFTALTNTQEGNLMPVWSRDHTKIAFVSRRTPPGIYVMDPDGSNAHLVWQSDLRLFYRLSWSPDGSQIVFAISTPGPSTANDGPVSLFVINADGTGLTPVLPAGTAGLEPAWSPDGSRIAFQTGQTFGGSSQIALVNPDGQGLKLLTPAPTGSSGPLDIDPTWSPNGRRIAFASTRDGWMSIYIMNADGTDIQRVTTPPDQGSDRYPAWSPDGAFIVFSRASPAATTDLYTVAPDGRGLTNVTRGVGYNYLPSW